ncbi:adenylate kinase-domain-containing protein [Powellomyces hirtus]|nr:adenylate kinase-domain-containing protein [Powellomyces hirtus]
MQQPAAHGLRAATTLTSAHHQTPQDSFAHTRRSWPIKITPTTTTATTPPLPIVLVLGGPGSGKGTQSMQLSKEFSLAHLSTGELLRNEVAAGTHIGKSIGAVLVAGQLVPDEIVMTILSHAIAKTDRKKHTGILIDGYPRTIEQATRFEQTIGKPTMVLYFDAPVDVLRQRLHDRGRFDDTKGAIEHRLQLHEKETAGVVHFFQSRSLAHPSSHRPPIVFHTQSALAPPSQVYAAARVHFLPTRSGGGLVHHPAKPKLPPPRAYPHLYRSKPTHRLYQVPAMWRSGKTPPRPLMLSYIHTQGASLFIRKLWRNFGSVV